ncbi:uncharacterized protein yc1106_09241 [Curvularia clavata]|uniref:Uncharacterized protein n=1 Tax=Curvularia clavata TaxID=95742 RepID=A0A9Q9DWK4_CURCL|nr:uncharacterized protein yc1106_09241 [Curvularia clavata]
MQFTTVAILLAAAIGANAAPTDFSKRLDAVPLSIFSGEQCASQAVTTAYIPTDGSCFPTSPIFSGNTNSFYVDPANLSKLPAGCSLVIYQDRECSGKNTKTVTKVGKTCLTFGAFKPIGSAKTVGTC